MFIADHFLRQRGEDMGQGQHIYGTRLQGSWVPGSGKSTVTRLIQRLYLATEGRVLLDGADAVIIDPAWLRSHIGSVEQDYPIFRRSTAENLALKPGKRRMVQVIGAARAACTHEFISHAAKGYATRSRGALFFRGRASAHRLGPGVVPLPKRQCKQTGTLTPTLFQRERV